MTIRHENGGFTAYRGEVQALDLKEDHRIWTVEELPALQQIAEQRRDGFLGAGQAETHLRPPRLYQIIGNVAGRIAEEIKPYAAEAAAELPDMNMEVAR